MKDVKYITIRSDGKQMVLGISTILYVLMEGKHAVIHVSGGKVYRARMPLSQLEDALGEGFLKVHRGCLVSVMAIHDITDRINLSTGEALEYTMRKKQEIIGQFQEKQARMIRGFASDGIPATPEEYHRYYSGADALPFAFTDIEMVFNQERRAVDWIFRYGNPALARLEKIPLEQLIGSSFGSLFSNMESKWLRRYERAALYGETLEIMDYSPEIDTWLKVICFPTFPGHCGCMLFNLDELTFAQTSGSGTREALTRYLRGAPGKEG